MTNWLPPQQGETVILGDTTNEAGRMAWLCSQYLVKIVVLPQLMTCIYKAPDGQLWIEEYPHAERHGGGPMRLRLVDRAQVKAMLIAEIS